MEINLWTSRLDVIDKFFNGISFNYEFVERRAGDQPFLVADNKLALKILNWSPKKSLFEMCNDSLLNYKNFQIFVITGNTSTRVI